MLSLLNFSMITLFVFAPILFVKDTNDPVENQMWCGLFWVCSILTFVINIIVMGVHFFLAS